MAVVVAAVKIAVGTRLLCWERLLFCWLHSQWLSGRKTARYLMTSVYSAPLSVRCVAVRAVMEFFHVCLIPLVISVVSAVGRRHVLN